MPLCDLCVESTQQKNQEGTVKIREIERFRGAQMIVWHESVQKEWRGKKKEEEMEMPKKTVKLCFVPTGNKLKWVMNEDCRMCECMCLHTMNERAMCRESCFVSKAAAHEQGDN